MAASEPRPIPANVSQIALEGAANIFLRQGEVPSMLVRCSHPEYLGHLLTDLSADCLTIRTKPVVMAPTVEGPASILGKIFGLGFQFNSGNRKIEMGGGKSCPTPELKFEVELVLPGVTSIRIKGSGDASYSQVQQTRMSILIAGSGSIEVQGEADSFEAHIAGSGSICARALKAQKVSAQISGSGDIEVTALASVTARVSGAGDIKVFGNPSQQDTKVSGSGGIRIKKQGHREHPSRSDDAPRG